MLAPLPIGRVAFDSRCWEFRWPSMSEFVARLPGFVVPTGFGTQTSDAHTVTLAAYARQARRARNRRRESHY